MSGLNKKHAAVAAFSMVCFLGGTYAGNIGLETAQNACAAEYNLSKDFFKKDTGFAICPDVKQSALFMALIGFGSGISALAIGAAIAGRKKTTPNNPAP